MDWKEAGKGGHGLPNGRVSRVNGRRCHAARVPRRVSSSSRSLKVNGRPVKPKSPKVVLFPWDIRCSDFTLYRLSPLMDSLAAAHVSM